MNEFLCNKQALTKKLLDPRVENDTSARPPNLTAASCNLDL